MVYCVPASRGDKGGETRAFMRLAQSKLLLRVISLAEDISSQRDRERIARARPGEAAGFTVSSGIESSAGYGRTVLNVFRENEEKEQAAGAKRLLFLLP